MSSEAITYFPSSLAASDAEKRILELRSEDVANDEALLQEIGSGSKEALGHLYDRLARSVYNVAIRILRDEGEAEDLVHEVFLFLHRKAPQFDPSKGSARTWIIHAAYTRALNRRNFLNVRRHYETEELQDERASAPYRDPEQLSVDRMTAQRLVDRFNEVLSPEQRRTLEMHFFQGCTFREIAEETGVPLDTIRKQYYRGCERLRALLPIQKDAQRD
jgi:RNA polymerase sigma-70 factor (ECF subfamily)